MESKKLNLGCGNDYREGWTNLDFNHLIKSDVYADISQKLPFDNDTFDYVYCSHTLEHFEKSQVFKIMEELCRICKKGAIMDIYVPHYTSVLAFKIPYHYSYYGVGTFRIFEEEETAMGERYSPTRLKVLKEELHWVLRDYESWHFLKYLGVFNPIFNFGGRMWQTFMERFWPGGFDEIWYKIEVVK